MKSTKKNKHLTFDDRIEIQECLSKGMTFKAIAKRIGKDPTTVSKEVKRRAVVQESGFTKTQDKCPRLMRSPFVCNGCERSSRASCAYPRLKYVPYLKLFAKNLLTYALDSKFEVKTSITVFSKKVQ